MTKTVREPYAAGKFYPSTETELTQLFDLLLKREKSEINYKYSDKFIIGAVLPHAGYIYSGYQTIHFFEILSLSQQKVDTFIVIHPIHRSGYCEYATDEYESWRTPLGNLELDTTFINAMNVPCSSSFHAHEHSGEVILPFIKKYFPHSNKFVPIGIGRQDTDIAKEIAGKITDAVIHTGRRVCVIASSDFSHYVRPDFGRDMDQKVIDRILDLDTKGVFREIMNNNISVCGFGPIMALMEYSKMNFPGVQAGVMARGHSGEVHPSAAVVDYVSILFYMEK